MIKFKKFQTEMPLQPKIFDTNQIVNVFTFLTTWAAHSKSKNFEAMFELVLPGSNFHELTQTCYNSHKSGNDYHYKFDNMEMVNFSDKDGEATIRGKITLLMPGLDIEYCGKFVSTINKEALSKIRKLNELNIEWD